MQKEITNCKFIITGVSGGFALVSSEPFSFWGGLDPRTGNIIDPRNNLFGQSIKDKVFVYPCGRGSSTTSAIWLEAIRRATAPRAIITVQAEPIIAIGILVAQEIYPSVVLPVAVIPEDTFRLLKTGDYLLVNSTAGKLYKKNKQ